MKDDVEQPAGYIAAGALVIMVLVSMLSGCSAKNSRTLAAGMGTIYQEDLCATYTITIQDEEHEADGAVEKFIGIFNNISGIPKAVLGALTSPERAFAETMDGDRKEVVVSFGLKDCKDVDISAIVKDINSTLDKHNMSAKAIFGGNEE